MDGLVPAVANLSVQPSLRRKPVGVGSTNTPPTFYAELEGSQPATPWPRAAVDFDQGLIPVEKPPPPDHEGLIPLRAPHSAHAVSHTSSPSPSPTAAVVPPPPSQTPGCPAAAYTPAAYPSRPQFYAPHPQPVLIPSRHSFPTAPGSSNIPPPAAGTHTAGQKLGDFASSVFSKETVKWSKKTASRFGGALKSAATSAHEAATKAQVAAARAAEQRKLKQASLAAPQQQQWKPAQPQTAHPQPLDGQPAIPSLPLPHAQHWASSHHQPHITTSPQQAGVPSVMPTPPHHGLEEPPSAVLQQPQFAYWSAIHPPAAVVAPVSQGHGPHLYSGSQTHVSPPPQSPPVGPQYSQASPLPLSPPPPPQQLHLPPSGHHLQHQQQLPDHGMATVALQQHYQPPPPPQPQTVPLPLTAPGVALAGGQGGGGSFLPPPPPPFPPTTSASQHSATVVPTIKQPTTTGSGSSALKNVGIGMTALAAVGGLTRLLIAATTGEDVGEMSFGSGGGEETAFDSGEGCEVGGGGGGGVEEGDGGGGCADTYADPSSASASTYADQQAALQDDHFVNMINAQANANGLSYVSDTTTYSMNSNLINDPYGYRSYGYTPDPASYI
ncbi:hypothetical protein B0T21DRAFT_351878 [Apiosordaria backusii]|uniref:Uncharacterized protein n=1 Tax=Apiosordaria backusii TaxID=314023 RepID=A0AA40AIG8_9PEZI|nr:hypothetical protein B0T21DRAFT_351878 [Apiosordaria backusii]